MLEAALTLAGFLGGALATALIRWGSMRADVRNLQTEMAALREELVRAHQRTDELLLALGRAGITPARAG